MVEIVRTPEASVADRAADLVVCALAASIEQTGSASLAISGGSAAAPVVQIRARLAERWRQIRLTWVDERCVDRDDPNSNRGAAYRSGALTTEQGPALELPLWCDDETPEAAVARVADGLRLHFSGGLDVALLGMGPDGHIASLFPNHAALAAPADSLVVHVADSPKPPASRMTLTSAFLQRTRHCFMVALGESKREVLQRLVGGDPTLPASRLANLVILTNLELGATQ